MVEPRSKQADKYFDKKETKETKGEAVKKEKSVVGRRKSASGRTIVKYDDGTYGEE